MNHWLTELIITKVFVKCKIVSVDTILSAYMHTNTHTGTCTHKNKVFVKCKILSVDTILSAYMHTNTHTGTCTHKNKVSVKCKILSVEIILSAFMLTNTHTGTCTHKNTDYKKLNLHAASNGRANRDLGLMKTAAWNGKHGYSFNAWKKI